MICSRCGEAIENFAVILDEEMVCEDCLIPHEAEAAEDDMNELFEEKD